MKNCIRWIGFTILLIVVNVASAQSWGPRNLEELKEETLNRARDSKFPIVVVNMADAERAMAALDDLERDSWATAWSDIGREYLALAKDERPPRKLATITILRGAILTSVVGPRRNIRRANASLMRKDWPRFVPTANCSTRRSRRSAYRSKAKKLWPTCDYLSVQTLRRWSSA